MIVEESIDYYKRTINARDKVYKIYSDNQISLKMIYVISLMHD